MKNTTKRAYVIFALIAAFFVGLVLMMYSFVVHGDEWVAYRINGHVYSNRQLSTAGTIFDRNGVALVKTENGKRVYNENYNIRVSTLHAVGDAEGFIATGVQTVYRPDLIGYDFVNGVYNAVKSDNGVNIRLTLDSNVCAAAYRAMNGNKGAVCCYNYKTGDIVCMVSAPTYDPQNKPSDINSDQSGKYDGIYLNRCISGVFTPGSTFKVVTSICALENIKNINKRTFTCTGKYNTGKGDVICNSKTGHGELTFERALNVSCNSVFAQLANELGKTKMMKTAKELGFGSSVEIGGAKTKGSYFDVSDSTKLDLGWAGIGQYTTLVNPCHMLMIAGAIANGGQAVVPRLVSQSSSILKNSNLKTNKNIKLDADIAAKIKKMMRSNVENYYGDSKFPNLKMCGKTGSAEVSDKPCHAWFYGFSQRSDFPYAIVVCLENSGGSGYSTAIPVANAVMQAVLSAQ